MAVLMAIFRFLGIVFTMRSRTPNTVSSTKIAPEIRISDMMPPKEIAPAISIAPNMALFPIPVERANGILA